jgi:hypothetical protein
VKILSQVKKIKMKNNQNDQLNKGKQGDALNQKQGQLGPKKENSVSQPVKKGNAKPGVLDPEEMEEGTTLEEGKEKKTEGKTGNKRGNL